jgi:hypothetical protein
MQIVDVVVTISLEEEEGVTRARAVLDDGRGSSVHGEGKATRTDVDSLPSEVGRALASSRALHTLAARLAHAAFSEITEIESRGWARGSGEEGG